MDSHASLAMTIQYFRPKRTLKPTLTPSEQNELLTPNHKQKKEPLKVLFKSRLEGFEPPTFWFVAKRSIQLGYKRKTYYSFIKTAPLEKLACLCRHKRNSAFLDSTSFASAHSACPSARRRATGLQAHNLTFVAITI